MGITFLGIALFPDVLKIGESSVQSFVVFVSYIYCIISLFTHSEHKLFYVLSLPILVHFLHIFQKYDFAPGANSLWRLAPFIILNIYLVYFLFSTSKSISNNDSRIVWIWICFHFVSLLLSPAFDNNFIGSIVIYLFTTPLIFLYLSITYSADNFRVEIEKYLCLGFILLMIGTLTLVFVGANYRGSDNLLISRNIADMNISMAYFILLWPFALRYSLKTPFSSLLLTSLSIGFLAIILLSFSRGALFLGLPYLLITFLLTIPKKTIIGILTAGVLIYSNLSYLADLLNQWEITYFWQLRFADIQSGNAIFSQLDSISGREQIHQTAFDLFLEKPWFGHGINSFEIIGPGYREAHSILYTLLAEQGLFGVIGWYYLFFYLVKSLWQSNISYIFATAAVFFLIFNHTVGSTFFIIPQKSISINCLGPILMMSSLFYSMSIGPSSVDFFEKEISF